MPAPAFTNLTSGGTASAATSFTTASVAPTGDRLILVSIQAYVGAGSLEPPAPTVRGNTIGYELVAEQQIDTAGTDRATLFVFRGMGAAPATGTILLDFGTFSITKIVWSVDQSDANVAVGSNGARAIVAFAGSKSASTVTTQPTNFPQTMGAGNSGFFACGMQGTETQTPRASWTELGDVGTINSCSIETQYIAGTDTAGSSTWVTAVRAGSIVLEVSPVDSGQTITAAVDSPDTYLPDSTLLSPADDDGGGDPALGYLYQPWPTLTVGAAIDVRNDTAFGTVGLEADVTAKKVAKPAGSGTIGVEGLATAKKVAVVSAVSSLGLIATPTAKKVSKSTGLGAVGLAGNFVHADVRSVTVLALVGLEGLATAKKVSTPTLNGAVGLAGAVSAKKVARPTVPAPVGFEGFVTAAKKAAITGLGTLGLGSQHSGVTPRNITALGELGFTATLAAKKRGTPLSAGTLGLTGNAAPKKISKSTGAGILPLAGLSIVGKRQPVTGRSILGLQAEWLRTPPVIDVNGRVVVTQTVVSTVDAGGPVGLAAVTQTSESLVSAASLAGGSTRIDPTEDGRAEVG